MSISGSGEGERDFTPIFSAHNLRQSSRGALFSILSRLARFGSDSMQGHALVPRLEFPELRFPFLVLLVSGGHTQLLVCDGLDRFLEHFVSASVKGESNNSYQIFAPGRYLG